jgi:hypothetical protein
VKRSDEPLAPAWSLETTPSWAKGKSLPDWLALREGKRPLVFVAPHGGRRLRPIRRGDSVNDLETADMAWELATRLDAHAIVNHTLDRNEIDLNRISHLAERAPGVLELLSAAIEAASRGGEVPLVLFVHGWNMVVPCCDIGIGLRRRAGEITGRFPTLSRRRFDTTIAAIEEELACRGVSASIGRRYTASGRDNAAQIFSGRHAEHENEALAGLARRAIDEGVDAAQLELGIPLRWKGLRREAFVEGVVAALARDAVAARDAGVEREFSLAREPSAIPRVSSGWNLEARSSEAKAGPSEPAYALQAVLDAASGIATFCGVESTGPNSMAARFSLVFTDGSMMLLVGEGDWTGEHGHYQLEGFDWHTSNDGARTEIRVRAPLVRYPTHDAYLDLEQGLASSRLVDADVDLVAERVSPDHARLAGRVEALGQTWNIDSIAFLERAGRRMTSFEPRIRILAARGPEDVFVARSGTNAGASLRLDEQAGRLGVIRRTGEEDPLLLRDAEILASVPVWRPLGQGVFVRWRFGIVRCRYSDGSPENVGLFDCTEVFGIPESPVIVETEVIASPDSVQPGED